ncbi:MAG: carboxypeptidase-like regulatory domain-containing protein [Saprospiraceae bacterium]|nr:carboxypeptidase-like regulatory domain-containing protein [Saprospiraceae bacterium]
MHIQNSGFFGCTFWFFLAHAGFTQITGKVLDEKGNPLAFATIYIEGTTKGVVANEQGVYEIEPAQTGTLTLVCQYLGYSKMQSRIHYKGVKIVHNFEMTPDLNLIGEVIIAADREDPAYSIIRNAIRKRNYYKNLVKSYETDLYIKGNIKVLKAPDQLLGSKVGNMDGVLDSTGQGILYLSESRSKFYFMAPDKKKRSDVCLCQLG